MKRVVRRKSFKISLHIQQTTLVFAGVLLFVIFIFVQHRMFYKNQAFVVKPVSIMTGSSFIQESFPRDSRWKDHNGWWGGYWWGSDAFTWKGREWGLGKSLYPWYWEYDRLALDLNLVELAKKNRWSNIENSLSGKISSLQKEMQETDNKATKRKLERTIDRVEYYLYNARQYQRAPIKFSRSSF